LESNVTAFLVRSISSSWRKGSVVAVDAGVHLGAILRILEKTQPPGLGTTDELGLPYTLQEGPFKGLEVPHASAAANAAHIHRTLIDTYLITHPHLDHISGFVINTAGLPGSRPKRLAGLPSTIAAFKTHIFNNVIWPNLSDENNGAGLVTYMRLVEGGSPALGEGEGKGYLEISDGLAVKIWGVSHGHCIERHSHRGSGSSARFGSMDASMGLGPMAMGMGSSMGMPLLSPRALAHHNSANPTLGTFIEQRQQQQQQFQQQGQGSVPGSSAPSGGRTSSISGGLLPTGESVCVYDSSAYFIRDVNSGREILIFGDVEPDSISLSPRNQQIWAEAAPKIAAGKLAAIFLECSYDDSQSEDRMFGHLKPKYIAEEMVSLAQEVSAARLALAQQERDAAAGGGSGLGRSGSSSDKKKRKREGDEGALNRRKTSSHPTPRSVDQQPKETSVPTPAESSEDPVSPRTVRPPPIRGPMGPHGEDQTMLESPHLATPTAELSLHDATLSTPVTPLSMQAQTLQQPLKGLKIVVIHVKEKMNDSQDVGEVILSELEEYEREAQLGVEYIISSSGQDLIF
jgi:cAMP phosphodiesterase